jgi:cell division protein ZipA
MDLLTEIGVREWLIGAGLLLVLAVLVDGFRRMRAERSGGLKMSIGMGGGFADDGSAVDSPELPNGGARVIDRTDPIISDQGPDDLFFEEDASEANTDWEDEEPMVARQAPVVEREIIVMHVRAKAADGFNGSDLLQILLACDMRYGEKDILHRHEKAEGKGCLQFSVANMLEPGTFNLEDINSFRTPGVTFFMTLPGPEDAMQAFDCMIETANCLVKNLDARLLDEEHSTASLQVINHYRDRVKQFNQKMNSALDSRTETV